MGSTWKELAVDLFERCRKAEEQYPGLALNLIEVFPARKMSDREVVTLVSERFGRPSDAEYEILPNNLIAMFHGDLSGYGGVPKIGSRTLSLALCH